MKTLQTRFFMLFLFISSVTFSQVTYNDYDANRDGAIDNDEFNERFSDNYDDYDTNRDGSISDRELYEANFNSLDDNGDRNLTQEEWEVGYDNMYGEHLDSNDFNRYDSDGNENISNEEYYNSLRTTDYYSSFDTNSDGSLDRDEMNQGIFNQWDRNQDGRIDNTEYDESSSFYQGDQIRPKSSY